MKNLVFFCFLAMSLITSGQNLVPNPSFEEFYKVPKSFSVHAEDFHLPGWNSASTGTPDYYHPQSWGDAGVPRNWAGESDPHGGKSYVGIYVGGGFGDRSYREYIQTKLKTPLEAEKWYVLEFYFRLASNSRYSIDRIGLHLFDTELRLDHNHVFEIEPTLSVIRPPEEAGEWEHAKMLYKAMGGESYLIIGNFFNIEETKSVLRKSSAGKEEAWLRRGYYYVDDVSVTEVVDPKINDTTSLWTDLVEIKPHQNYVLNNIQFDFDSYELIPSSFMELDQVVNTLKHNPSWRIEIRGHADDQGSEEYNMELSANRAKGVADYLEAGGIEKLRMRTKGFGKGSPLFPGKDERSRTMNRRVEVYFSGE